MINFALPVGHTPTGTGAAVVTIPVYLRRPFRQPVLLPDSGNFYKGLELWLQAHDPADATTGLNDAVSAMFNGVMKFLPGTTPQQEASGTPRALPSLQLDITDKTIVSGIRGGKTKDSNETQRRTMTEAVIRRVVYENISAASVNEALVALVTIVYATAVSGQPQANWHPILKGVFNKVSVKSYIDQQVAGGSNVQAAATTVVDNLVNQSVSFAVKAGDWVGRADVLSATDALPGFPAPSTLTNPKFCRIVTMDIGLFHINPAYYIWRFFTNANYTPNTDRTITVISYAPIRTDQTFQHPLTDLLSIGLNTTQLPRATVNITLPGETTARNNAILFPVIKTLSDWRGNENVFATTGTSIVQWHVLNDATLSFETRRRSGTDTDHTRIKLCGETSATAVDACMETSNIYDNLTDTIWNGAVGVNRRNAIEEICTILQMPVEIMNITIGVESSNKSTACALEPLNDQSYLNSLRANNYHGGEINEAMITAYTSKGGRYSRHVSTNDTDLVDSGFTNPSSLTWGQVRAMVAYIPARISPGLSQTLVSTAMAELKWLEHFYPDFATVFNVDPITTGTQPTDYRNMFDWLVQPRNAILVSVARHKRSYDVFATYYNLYRTFSAYNGNGANGNPFGAKASVWGLRFYGNNYPQGAGRYYNSLMDKFMDPNDVTNSSPRFWQALPNE